MGVSLKNAGPTLDKISDLVRELDEDEDNSVSKQEFKTLLLKHSNYVDGSFSA